MVDNLKPEDRKKAMRAVKGKGTSLERQLSSILSQMGLRGWRKNVGDILGKPDVAFIRRRVAIFIDGCFWHRCPHCRRKLPKTNRGYWQRKIRRNVELAKSNERRLRRDGWIVVRIWEHEMRHPCARQKVRLKIRRAVERRR